MCRSVLFFFLLFASCSTNLNSRDLDLQVIINYARSYKYDLNAQTYTVSRVSKPDTVIHFSLSKGEIDRIISKYNDLGLASFQNQLNIVDSCFGLTASQQLSATIKATNKTSVQVITIQEGCEKFAPVIAENGKKIISLLQFMRKIIDNKQEIIKAPKSDIQYRD
jgi:hypothetical protein